MKFQQGKSGNPRGRPSNASKATPFTEAIKRALPEIIDRLIEQAKGGDFAVQSLLLSRMLPPLRAVTLPTPFAIEGDTLASKAESVLQAVGRGELAISDAKALLDGLSTLAKLREIDDLTQRIEALEQQRHDYDHT